MSSLYNRARVSTATVGTGTMTLGAATSNAFFTFAEAGVPDGTVVSYVIEDGSNVELGIGTYTTSGTTLSRTTVTASKVLGVAGTSKLVLTGSAIVYIDALAADITVPPASATDNAVVRFDGTTGRAIQNTGLTIDDSDNLFGPSAVWFINAAGGGSLTSIGAPTIFGGGTASSFLVLESTFGTGTTDFIQLLTGSQVQAVKIDTNQNVMVGPGVADRRLHAEQDSATTNTVTYVERLTSTSTGTPANGIGVGQEFEVETSAGNNEIGATIEAYAWDTTAASEDFDVVFKTMSAGATATEKGRTGFMPVNMVQSDSLTLLSSYSMVVSTQYSIPTGLTLTMAANSVMRIL